MPTTRARSARSQESPRNAKRMALGQAGTLGGRDARRGRLVAYLARVAAVRRGCRLGGAVRDRLGLRLRLELLAPEHLLDVLAVEDLPLEERLREGVQLVDVVEEQLPGAVVRALDEAPDLL